ncbi:MAG TPA: hypothetical protein VI542_37515, partial [Candidatus Tectomicrobia bacterium]
MASVAGTRGRIAPRLKDAGYDVTYFEVDGPHWVTEEAARRVLGWLVRSCRGSKACRFGAPTSHGRLMPLPLTRHPFKEETLGVKRSYVSSYGVGDRPAA